MLNVCKLDFSYKHCEMFDIVTSVSGLNNWTLSLITCENKYVVTPSIPLQDS